MVTRVFVIDDHPIVAHGVALVIEDDEELTFAGSAESLNQHTLGAAPPPLDVVLLDVRLPDIDVVTAVRLIRRQRPEARILLFTADPAYPPIRDALAAGATATVPKDTPPKSLREIVKRAAAGQAVGSREPESLLTSRQHDVLVLVATGMTNLEIADELGIQPTTVKAYWQETMQRLGVRNRPEAIATAYRRGLL